MSVDALGALSHALSYTHEEVYLKRAKGAKPQREHETRRISLMVKAGEGYVFPSGLLHRALATLEKLGVTAEIVQRFVSPDLPSQPPTRLPDGTELYPDQVEAVLALLTGQRGLAALAPNFGKTEVIAALLAASPNQNGLVIDSSRARIEQTAARLTERLREPVPIFSGTRDFRTPRVFAATIQTLARSVDHPTVKRLLGRTLLLLADEAHCVSPRLWFKVLGGCGAPIRIGLSGSVRDVASPVITEAFFGPILHEAAEAPLIASGRSAKSEVYMPYAGSMVPDSPDYDDVYWQAVVTSESRNALLADALALCARLRLPTVALFYRHEHGERLERACVARGLAPQGIRRLDGRTPPQVIQEAKEDFTAGRVAVLIASGIFNQGIDLPTMRVLVNAAAWKSPLATGQKLGRIARRKVEILSDGTYGWGDNRGLVVDPFDLGNRTLKRHSQARERTYAKKGSPVIQGTWTDVAKAIEAWAQAG